MFFSKDELVRRIAKRNSDNRYSGSTLVIHSNAKCKLPGFVGVGPYVAGSLPASWFDMRIVVGSTEYHELDRLLKEIVKEYSQFGLAYLGITE